MTRRGDVTQSGACLIEGEVANGVYEVERLLGEGAYAEVYRVKHPYLGRLAMKVFKTPGMTSGEMVSLLEEARLLSKLGHPNIIRIFDAGTIQGPRGMHGYFTMEYVRGGTLDGFLGRRGRLPVAVALEIAIQVCKGLGLAHSNDPPIIHRDLTIQNILIEEGDRGLRAVIGDFGLAKQVNPLLMFASVQGTICFKPPEALSGFRVDSAAADVWAIGAILYFMLTGELPFPMGQTRPDFKRPVAPARHSNPEVGPDLERTLSRALALLLADRYSNAIDLVDDLEQVAKANRARWQL